jgi:hypothetical protein
MGKYSLSKEGDNRGWTTVLETTSSGTCTTVVHNGRDPLEQPFVWAVAQWEHVGWKVRGPKLAPATRQKYSLSRKSNRFQQSCCQCIRIIDDDRAESNLYGCWSNFEESHKVGGRFVLWCVSEEESTNIDILRPVCGFWNKCSRPAVGERYLLGIWQEGTLCERYRLNVEFFLSPRVDNIFQSVNSVSSESSNVRRARYPCHVSHSTMAYER